MHMLEFVTGRVEEETVIASATTMVKERRFWITSGSAVIEGRIWQHADVVREAKLCEYDRENAAVRAA